MVCDATFRITNLVAKWPGSVHDSRIFRDSALATKLENGMIFVINGTYNIVILLIIVTILDLYTKCI